MSIQLRVLPILLLTATIPVQAAMLPGAGSRAWPANAAKHQIVVVRTAANDTERQMIAAAEAAPPVMTAVAADGKPAPTALKDARWWHKEVNGAKIACAITGAAVEYYSALVEGFKKQVLTRFIEPNSKFSYAATVRVRENYPLDGKILPRVYVVKMSLSFSEFLVLHTTQGIQFSKDREVILDPEGKVLQVTGDGETEVPVVSI